MKSSAGPTEGDLWIFDEAKLLAGDVVLERGSDPSSHIVAGITGGHYSHAMLWLGATDFIEAMPGGVRTLSSKRVVVRNPNDWMLLRAKPDLRGRAANAANEARRFAFKKYDTPGALRSPVAPRAQPIPTAMFCSQLVVESYRLAGIELLPGRAASGVTPNDLPSSPFLDATALPLVLAEGMLREALQSLNSSRSVAYQSSQMAKELGLATVMFDRALPLVEGASWPVGIDGFPPGNLIELLSALPLLPRQNAIIVADQLLADMRGNGYFELLHEPLADLIGSGRAVGQLDRVPGWDDSRRRHLQNATTYVNINTTFPHQLWQALASMHAKYAAGFEVLIDMGSSDSED